MKITSASKKVLASALSAAMVVAFAPTAAFAAIDSSTDTSKWTDADFVAAGAIAKKTWVDSEIHNQYFFSTAELNANMNATYTPVYVAAGDAQPSETLYISNDGSADTGTFSSTVTAEQEGTYYKKTATASGTIKLLKDIAAKAEINGTTDVDTVNDGAYDKKYAFQATAGDTDATGLTIDLNGFTLGTKYDEGVGEGNLLEILDGNVTIKGGTLSATNDKAAKATYYAIVDTAGDKVTVDGITADEVYGTVDAVKGAVTLGDVTGSLTAEKKAVVETGKIGADATVKEGASLTASKTSTAAGATAIGGKLTVSGKDATVAATAISSKDDAVAIAGGIDAFDGTNGKYFENVKITAQAKTTAENSDATAVAGGTILVDQIEAKADSSYGTAYGIYAHNTTLNGKTEYNVNGGSVVASGKDALNSVAVFAAKNGSGALEQSISGGSFDGKLTGVAGISGGSFTDDPSQKLVNTTDYDVTYAGGVYTVNMFQKFNVNEVAGSVGDNLLQGALQTIATSGTVSGIAFTEGWDAQKMLTFAKGEGAGKLYLDIKIKAYSEKAATDEQKAAKAALDEAIKADLQYTDDTFYQVVTAQIVYDKTGVVDPIVVADVTDLGTKTIGMQAKDNTEDVTVGQIGTVSETAWQSINGKAEKVAFKDANKDGKHQSTETSVSLRYIPTLITCADIDPEAVKNAAEKGEEVATEKATQSISVDQKSLTVKLGAKKKATAKGKSFNMGATAETAITTEWKSGSTKITVSGDKVKLAKGAKKGTYKAQISLKAAGSDAYLAAAATITVKFVIKK